MLSISVRFPLGVYYAKSGHDPTVPEWPPSPVRLVGGLLAAAHDRGGDEDPVAERRLIARICAAAPPEIVAPTVAAPDSADGELSVAELRGPSRWAPVNYFDQNRGRRLAAVEKVGVAVGERTIHFLWDDLVLEPEELETMRSLAAELAFLGTARSPVIAVVTESAPSGDGPRWRPRESIASPGAIGMSRDIRVPDRETLAAFDMRHEEAMGRPGRVEAARFVPARAVGHLVRYLGPAGAAAVARGAGPGIGLRGAAPDPIEAGLWGDAIIVPVDREMSEMVPRLPVAYLVARAARVALLGAFGDPGRSDEAPPILRARGADPHCAIVPLASVGFDRADGRILGIAIQLPSAERVDDLADQRRRLEAGLVGMLRGGRTKRRFIAYPGAGRLYLAAPDASSAAMASLDTTRYEAGGTTWSTVTPVVHSRWPKAKRGGVFAEVVRDLGHVGLPEPVAVEVLGESAFPGARSRMVPARQVPHDWRGSYEGKMNHLRIEFERPVRGPVLIGRARHFGIGLLLPAPRAGAARGAR